MIPEIAATAGARYESGPLALELTASYSGRQYLIGDEANEEEFERLAASTVLDVGAEWTLGDATVFARVGNLLDTDFDTFGMISENSRGPIEQVERFLTPGLPRRLSAGVRVRFGGA
jgi:outer membrane cobalamin receptor